MKKMGGGALFILIGYDDVTLERQEIRKSQEYFKVGLKKNFKHFWKNLRQYRNNFKKNIEENNIVSYKIDNKT